jgi:hypothetical protein
MDKLERWQPLFRFLKRFNQSDLVGLVFSIVYLTAVVAIWYWVCFKNGAEVWRNEIVLRNKRFGFNVEWLTPFLVKVGANILLWGSIIGLFLGLLSYINKR